MSSVQASSDDLLLDAPTIETIQGDGSLFVVLAVQLDDFADELDTLIQTIVGTFTLTEHSGAYTVDIRWSRQWDVDLNYAMTNYATDLDRVYSLPVER